MGKGKKKTDADQAAAKQRKIAAKKKATLKKQQGKKASRKERKAAKTKGGASTLSGGAGANQAVAKRKAAAAGAPTKKARRRFLIFGKRKDSGSQPARSRIAQAAQPLQERRKRLVGARETTMRDLGGLMLEMYKRNRFREELLLDKCEEILAIEVEIAHIDQRLFQLSPPNPSGQRPIGRCECGSPIMPGQNFCASCGRSLVTLTQTRACTRCAAGLRAGDAFCSVCGTPAPDILDAIAPPAMASTQPPGTRTGPGGITTPAMPVPPPPPELAGNVRTVSSDSAPKSPPPNPPASTGKADVVALEVKLPFAPPTLTDEPSVDAESPAVDDANPPSTDKAFGAEDHESQVVAKALDDLPELVLEPSTPPARRSSDATTRRREARAKAKLRKQKEREKEENRKRLAKAARQKAKAKAKAKKEQGQEDGKKS